MNPAEYENLARIEVDHWYYSGKRELVRFWLTATGAVDPDRTLLDCGAGTGQFAQEMEQLCRILVLDDHVESLDYLRRRFRPEQVLTLMGNRIPLPDASVDALTALDVLEHVPDDAGVMADFRRVLKSNGVVVITVPASMALWSDWDVALHHCRRYDRRSLLSLFPPSSWVIEHVNYTNVLAYPAVWVLRRWRQWFPSKVGRARVEDAIPSPGMNKLLRWLFVGLGKSKIPFPFGVSLILVARKR
jgi:SAM-dependent methyltransferase